jgi:hypothetical protein
MTGERDHQICAVGEVQYTAWRDRRAAFAICAMVTVNSIEWRRRS